MARIKKEYQSRGRAMEIQRLSYKIVDSVFSATKHRLNLEKEIDEAVGPELRIIEDLLARIHERLLQTIRVGFEKALDKP